MPAPLVLAVGVVSFAASLASSLLAFFTGAPLAVVVLTSLLGALGAAAIAGAVSSQVLQKPLQRLAAWARAPVESPQRDSPPQTGSDVVDAIGRAMSVQLSQMRESAFALAVEYDRLAAALSNMADGIVIVNADVHVHRINEAAARMFGVPCAEAAGRTLMQVVRDHDLTHLVARAIDEGTSLSTEVRLVRVTVGGSAHLRSAEAGPTGSAQDGHVTGALEERDARAIRASAVPLAGGHLPEVRSCLLVLQDVTEVRRAATIRREFVGNVSHELRTPIASLKALVETLEEGALEDPPAAREFLTHMHVEVDSLAQLVQELLELSRIESGQATPRPEAVAPQGLLEDVSRRLRRQAERTAIAVTITAAPDLPPVWADPALIERVLMNLLHNAIKFTPPEGRITLGAALDPDGVRFSVADTGIGIAPEDLPRLFERFYKVDRSRASRGTGLGLAIAKHIVQAHGGRIWAESRGEGQGSTFSLILPLAPTNHSVDGLQHQLPPALKAS